MRRIVPYVLDGFGPLALIAEGGIRKDGGSHRTSQGGRGTVVSHGGFHVRLTQQTYQQRSVSGCERCHWFGVRRYRCVQTVLRLSMCDLHAGCLRWDCNFQ